jgi:photosystem II stability/assembly factor-like uncharacterized protein
MQRAITPPETIRLAQEALAAAGYDPGKPDGRMGPRTAAALKKFQTDRNLSPTGELDPATITALNIKGLVPLTEMVNALAHTYDERDGAPGIFAATGSGLYRSYDPERGWERIEYGAGYDARTMCVFVSERDPKMIWVGTATSGVLVSHDGGATWQQVKGVPATAPISSIAQNPKRPDYIYVGSTQMLYVSRDGGETWLPRGNELPLGNYTSILINPENSDEVFVGNAYERGGGVFRSTDGGLTWQRMDAQLPSRRVWALASDTSDLKRIFVGSHSAGIYVASRPAGVAVSANDGK